MTMLTFNLLLERAGVDPAEVRLLRHQTRLPLGGTPFELWRTNPDSFDRYQSYQLCAQRAWFKNQYWASFVGLSDGRTLFVGLYEVDAPQLLAETILLAETGQTVDATLFERYPLRHVDMLAAYEGKLHIDWGGGSSGRRAWRQRADQQDKPIVELRNTGHEPPFPGYMQMMTPLSQIVEAPDGWTARLEAVRGVYLLTCPRTGELYVGSATGPLGFWGRWMNYEVDGHGGNVALLTRERSDWLISILQVAGSSDTLDDILTMEALWKEKLQSRSFGLNRN